MTAARRRFRRLIFAVGGVVSFAVEALVVAALAVLSIAVAAAALAIWG